MRFQLGRPFGDVSGRKLLVLDSSEVESTAANGVFIGLDWGNSHHSSASSMQPAG